MKNKIIAFDSNIFIYQFEEHPIYSIHTNKLFQKLSNGHVTGVSSVISITETLAYPLPEPFLGKVIESFNLIPNFIFYDITKDIAIESARIRREYGIRLPDAIQLATAIAAKATIFITNDKRLKNFPEVKVELL